MLINTQELKRFKNSNAFIKYSSDIDDICINIEEYNLKKERKILIIFYHDDMISNKKLNPIVTELFIRGRKVIISLVLQNLILLYRKILN